MSLLQTTVLFIATAIAEIVGCYLPSLWLNRNGSPLLLIPAALSLILFSWLLTLHPTSAGRVYAAYGGVYISVAVFWMWQVEGIRPIPTDWIGAVCCLIGMGIIILGARVRPEVNPLPPESANVFQQE